jgi:hypothetical protein
VVNLSSGWSFDSLSFVGMGCLICLAARSTASGRTGAVFVYAAMSVRLGRLIPSWQHRASSELTVVPMALAISLDLAPASFIARILATTSGGKTLNGILRMMNSGLHCCRDKPRDDERLLYMGATFKEFKSAKLLSSFVARVGDHDRSRV